MEETLLDIAKGLAPSLLTAASHRVRDEALGDEQERALNAVFADATAAVLVEVARHGRGDRGLPDRLAGEFEKFYRDTWVAETLVDFAISAEEPPLDGRPGHPRAPRRRHHAAVLRARAAKHEAKGRAGLRRGAAEGRPRRSRRPFLSDAEGRKVP